MQLKTAAKQLHEGKKSKVQNLKMTASMKVKAGTRLLMAEARVGELMLIPL